MINDDAITQEIQDEWDGVRSFQSRIQASLNMSGGMGSTGAPHHLRNISHNLTLLFAFSVLENALTKLCSQDPSIRTPIGLKALMRSSKKVVEWKNFSLIDTARKERDKVAHKREILDRTDCWKYIDGIESELLAWKLISNPEQFIH